jgi:hypothetical protein
MATFMLGGTDEGKLESVNEISSLAHGSRLL